MDNEKPRAKRRPSVSKVCQICSKSYFVRASRADASKACSWECNHALKRTLPEPVEKNCHTCGKVFTHRRDRPDSKFCSKPCQVKWWSQLTYSPEQYLEWGRKSGDAQRGKGEGKAYRKLYGRHEHRVIAEQKLGRPLKRGEIVHHKDENILNNDPSNLQVMTQAEHMRLHGLGIPGQKPKWMK